jgi:hypothetical protein
MPDEMNDEIRVRIEMLGDPEGHRHAREEAMALLRGFWRGEEEYGRELARVVTSLTSRRVPAEHVQQVSGELAFILDATTTAAAFAIAHLGELEVSREVAVQQVTDEIEERAKVLFG